MNVQTVCSHDLKFTHIVARWPGSVHDSRIFRNSSLESGGLTNDYALNSLDTFSLLSPLF